MSELLVYAMTTKGEMKIEQFNEMFNMVYLPNAELKEQDADMNQIVRLLDALGYCEFDFKNRTVYMCPPCLALLPGFGLPKAVLTGARTPALIAKIKSAIKVRKEKAACSFISQKNKNINIPVSVVIEAVDVQTIEDISKDIGIICRLERPTAWDLVNASSSLYELKESLIFEEMAEPGWVHRIFVPSRLAFSRNEEEKKDGRLVKYTNPVTQQPIFWVWKGGKRAEIDIDWGRYLVLGDLGIQVLLYDGKHHRLAVPAYVPFPCLLARAITMCTGMAPAIRRIGEKLGAIPAEYPVHIYSGVPPVIAKLIAGKLGQETMEANLENKKSGALYD